MHRVTWDSSRGLQAFAHPAVTVFGQPFQVVTLTIHLPHQGPATPKGQVPSVWTNPLSLATTDGIASFYFPGVTEMFHFTPFRFAGL